METIKERLNLFVEKQGLTGRAFSASIGKSVSYLGMMKDNISTDILQKIHEVYPQVNISWLLFGEGDMFVSDETKQIEHEHILSSNEVGHATTTDKTDECICDNVDVLGQSEFLRLRRRCEKLTDSNMHLSAQMVELTNKIVELTDYILSLHNSHEI